MVRIERTNEKYNLAMVKELLRADLDPPEAAFDNAEDMLAWLDDLNPLDSKTKSPPYGA